MRQFKELRIDGMVFDEERRVARFETRDRPNGLTQVPASRAFWINEVLQIVGREWAVNIQGIGLHVWVVREGIEQAGKRFAVPQRASRRG